MCVKRIIVSLVFILSVAAGKGQSLDSVLRSGAPDSAKANFLSIYAFSISEDNPDSALILAKYGAYIARRAGNEIPLANCLSTIGWAYFKLGKLDSAKERLNKARSVFHQYGEVISEARAMMNIASINQAEGKLEESLQLLLAAMKLTGSSRKTEYAVAEKMIGILYRKQGNTAKAKLYLKNAAADFLRIDEQKYYADAISSLGILYHAQGDPDSAIYYYKTALVIYMRVKNGYGVALIYDDLGQEFLIKSRTGSAVWLDSSLLYFNKAYYLFKELNCLTDALYEKSAISEILLTKKQYGQAEVYLKELLPFFEAGHMFEYAQKTLLLLSRLHSEKKEFGKAYDFLQRANVYNDTLNLQSRNAAIADMLEKYESGKKDSIIALLNTQNSLLHTQKQLAERDLYKTRIIQLFILTLVVLLASLGFVVWTRYRIKQKLKEVQMRNRISNDLHDDVGSSLSSILLLSKIADSDIGNKQEIIHKIGATASDMVERISDIVWATNPKYDDGESLRTKIMNYVVFLNEVQGISASVNIQEEVKGLKLPMEVRQNIFLVLKEALNNVLKHANASEITIGLSVKEKNIVLEISDNGKGFVMDLVTKGNGLESMHLRINSSGGRIDYNSFPGKGTTILAKIPLREVRNAALKN